VSVTTPSLSPPAPAVRAPLGPGSLTWDSFGDLRTGLLIVRAGVLQAMHPAIGAALSQHSDVFANQWNRLFRSLPPIVGVVYAGPRAPEIGAWVRDQHRGIGGHDAHGRRYHALEPEVYHWAHATFFESQIAMRRLFGTPFTRLELDRLYDESRSWYAQYGVSMRPMPEDYAAFTAYWDHVVHDVLEPTEAVRWTFATHRRQQPPPFPSMPSPVWRALRLPVVDGQRWIARGTLPDVVRERLDLRWTAGDERRLRALRRTVRATWPHLPAALRYPPKVRAAIRAAGG
jgi:uncharacterized protein (DUF2236 family)